MGPQPAMLVHSRVLLVLAVLTLALSGCSLSSRDAPGQPGTSFQGRVRGGQQPVTGASVFLYAAGNTSGNGQGAHNLLSAPVTTDAAGNFNLTGAYFCPSPATQVYLAVRGGNPGLAPNSYNSAITLVAALGDCGNLTASTFINVNEVTTAAAAWALNQFVGPAANIGASAGNVTGLRNGFLTAANLADVSTGTAPGALPTGASSETSKINALANTIASCVNSDGTGGCAALFSASTVGGSIPSNTLDAALNIVRNPAANVAAVLNAGVASGPFLPALPLPPHDWTMSITFGNCTSSCGGLNQPASLAVDAAGNVWVANFGSPVLSEFSPAGVAIAPNGFPGSGLRESYGLTIDGFGNAWVANQQSVSAANNHHYGSISKFSPGGIELSGFGYTGGGIFYPQAIAADSNGDIWIADNGSSSASLLANDGSALSGSGGYAQSQLTFASAVAIDASHNAWFGVQGAVVKVTPSGFATRFSCCSYSFALAVDQTASTWVADYGAGAIVQLSSTGAILSYTSTASAGLAPAGIAIDGSGNVWASNYVGNSITAISGSTATMSSPLSGFGLDAPIKEPYSLAIDASGNIWLSNAASSTLTQIVGLASPVATPVLGPPVAP